MRAAGGLSEPELILDAPILSPVGQLIPQLRDQVLSLDPKPKPCPHGFTTLQTVFPLKFRNQVMGLNALP